jgi:hypothetical protein
MSRISTRAAELSERLAQNAQAVCRHYLPAGRREGRYWMVGDVAGAPGRSLYVRLFETERGSNRQLGRCRDRRTWRSGRSHPVQPATRATGRHHRRGRTLPQPAAIGSDDDRHCRQSSPSPHEQDRQLLPNDCSPPRSRSPDRWRQPICVSRGITHCIDLPALRFHPRCYYRPNDDDVPEHPAAFPALIAAVTDDDGVQTGTHRTWLDPSGNEGQGRIAAPGDGQHSRQRGPVRNCGRRPDRGRRHRDHAVLARSPANHADGSRHLVGPSRRHPVPADTSAPLCRARPGCGRRRGVWHPDRPHRQQGSNLCRSCLTSPTSTTISASTAHSGIGASGSSPSPARADRTRFSVAEAEPIRGRRIGLGRRAPSWAIHRPSPAFFGGRPRDRLPGGRNGGHAAIFRRRASECDNQRAPFHREPK